MNAYIQMTPRRKYETSLILEQIEKEEWTQEQVEYLISELQTYNLTI